MLSELAVLEIYFVVPVRLIHYEEINSDQHPTFSTHEPRITASSATTADVFQNNINLRVSVSIPVSSRLGIYDGPGR